MLGEIYRMVHGELSTPPPLTPEQRDLRLAYHNLTVTATKALQEYDERPDERSMVIELMGARIRERALRVTSLAAEISHVGFLDIIYLPVKNYWFILNTEPQRLIRPTALKRRFLARPVPDLEGAEDVPSGIWFYRGVDVARTVIEHFTQDQRLPQHLLTAPIET
ncbi:MAG: hypothetical protein UU21_C0025G0002 [Candidatus Levybacteria bacterium GW2011_GWA2_40_8]|nr:MAG: hypothetical protein UU21_C0025G0002 [Candidatus Levybacteria bacterium GW2011_GWA2_40_8]